VQHQPGQARDPVSDRAIAASDARFCTATAIGGYTYTYTYTGADPTGLAGG
jgi:hypothetical protein